MSDVQERGRIPHVDDWQDHYPTTTYRGPGQYPVPEDWVLHVVEADGAMWKLWEGIGEEFESDNEVADDDYDRWFEGPDGDAALGIGIKTDADHELIVDGEVVFAVDNGDVTQDELWAATAAILARHSRGEDYEEIAEAVNEATPDTSEQSLSDFL